MWVLNPSHPPKLSCPQPAGPFNTVFCSTEAVPDLLLPVLTEALLEWRGPVVYMVQSEGDLQTVQCHNNVFCFYCFLGAFTTSFGDFYYCWALCWCFYGTSSQPLFGSHSSRAAVSLGAIISKVKWDCFPSGTAFHIYLHCFSFSFYNTVSWGPSQTSLALWVSRKPQCL